ncbi:hypothetical protein BDV23DRAFT_157942 [Aspergillus alliaceus]|uniref:Secreted protein n=1 Tax=Petromyces alliaceus TaxID=209559 RepID=A0A5N7C4J9_PETAA|nr:hypothetical protein BDV23DRAFT_157942 [Aspergillus alliaceus]
MILTTLIITCSRAAGVKVQYGHSYQSTTLPRRILINLKLTYELLRCGNQLDAANLNFSPPETRSAGVIVVSRPVKPRHRFQCWQMMVVLLATNRSWLWL